MTAAVAYLENALVPQNRRVLSVEPARIRDLAPTDWQTPYVAFLDGQPVLRADWELVLEDGHALAFIDVNAIPQGGGGGGGSNPLTMVLMIAVMVYAPYLATSLEFAAMGVAGMEGFVLATGAYWAMAAQMIGMALINAMLPPPQPTTPQAQAALAAPSPTYSLQAQGNTARLEAAIPEQFGRMQAYLDFAAQPYSEFAGNEQYVYQLLCLGRGAYDVEDVRIEDTPVASFDDISYEVVPPGGALSLFPANVTSSLEVSGQTLDCVAGTYTLAGTLLTVTAVAHGLSTGRAVYLDFTSGAAADGAYTVASAPTADTFTVTFASGTSSGNVTVSTYVGPFTASAPGSAANYLGLDFVAPRGLYYANDSGGLAQMSTSLVVEARPVDDNGTPLGGWVALDSGGYTPWTDWTRVATFVTLPPNTATVEYRRASVQEWDGATTVTVWADYRRTRAVATGIEPFSAATTTPQRYSRRYAVAAGRYQVRVRRLDVQNKESRAGHEMVWGGLRAYLPDTRVYGDVTLLALRMRASNNLSMQASRKVNVIATRKLPVWNGSTWSAPTATRSIAWALAYAAKQVGLTDAQIDLAALLTLDATWTSRGDRFDARFDSFLGFWEAASKIAGAGRAKPFMQGGVLRVFRDQAATVPVALFSMRNIVKGSFSVDYLMPTADTADAVRVGYFDETNWAPARVQAKLPGSTAAKPAKVDLFGVTGRDHAFREGMYQAASNRYRRRLIKFATEMEGFIPSYGDLIAIQHDMPAWGQGGEITAWDAGSLTATLSEPPTWGAGTHYLGLRQRDGSVAGPYVVTAGALPNQVVLASAPAFTPYVGGGEERTHYSFGWAETWRQRARVLSVQPQSLTRVQLECVNEDDAVHTAEVGATTPAAPSSQLAGYTNAPALASASAYPMKGNPGAMLLAWPATAWANKYVVEQSSDGDSWTNCGDTGNTSFVAQVLYGKASQFRVAAIGLSRGPWVSVTPDTTPPADVTSVAYALEQFGIRLTWPSIIDLALDAYELRTGGTDWDSATFLATVYGNEYLWQPQAAGSYTVRVKAVDTSGNYSVNAAATTVTITVPSAPAVTHQFAGTDEVLGWSIPASGGFLVDRYEIRTGASWATATFVDSTKATSYRRRVDYLGQRTYWVAAIDAAGNVGAAGSVVSTVAAPGAVTALRAEVIDNNVLVYWSVPASGSMPVERYEARKGASWDAGVSIGSNGNSTFTTVFEQVSGSYSYWVAAVDSAGNVGAATSTTVYISQPPDYVLRASIDSTLSGAKVNALLDGGTLLLPVNTAETWEQHFSNHGWATPQDQINAGFPVYIEPGLASASYSEDIDYGSVLPTTNIQVTLEGAPVAGTVGMSCQISTKLNAGDAWTQAPAGATSALAISFRYVRVAWSFSATAGANLLRVTGMNTKISVKQRGDSGSGSSAVGGSFVPFNYAFLSADTPSVQPAGSTPLIPVVIYAGGPNPSGFTVKLYNTSGVEVGGDFSWSVRGY